ncbi:DEAD/DEAH box helicase family protein, partial [Escherichia coli]|uniref:DEAD/DEAH box helicase family protein n=1 Tax=Escherichia coli TaxID=562 RepID=UPI0021DF43B5
TIFGTHFEIPHIMKLRPYQQQAKDEVRSKFTQKHRRIMVVAPTGAGKSLIFTDLTINAIKRGKRVMIIADRWELLDQARNHLSKNGIRPTMI